VSIGSVNQTLSVPRLKLEFEKEGGMRADLFGNDEGSPNGQA
jgi:hypothetical protein